MNKFALITLIISIALLSGTGNMTLARNIPGEVSSKVCTATTKVCVLNITNELTVKDDELLQACKDCCAAPQLISVRGCTSRCQKSCAKAYKKVTSGH